jgi:hypothetical protein
MEAENAMERYKNWGDKACTHETIVKEYYLGTQTGDYACTKCGLAGTKVYMEQQQKEANGSNE